MRCHEFHGILRAYVDGEVDSTVGKEIAGHLSGCAACADMVEDTRRWDASLTACLDRDLPSDLRNTIIGGTAGDTVPRTNRVGRGLFRHLQPTLPKVRRGLIRPRGVMTAAAVAAIMVLAVIFRPVSRPTDPNVQSFRRAGPITQVGEAVDWQPGDTLPTARLSLSGRLI